MNHKKINSRLNFLIKYKKLNTQFMQKSYCLFSYCNSKAINLVEFSLNYL